MYLRVTDAVKGPFHPIKDVPYQVPVPTMSVSERNDLLKKHARGEDPVVFWAPMTNAVGQPDGTVVEVDPLKGVEVKDPLQL